MSLKHPQIRVQWVGCPNYLPPINCHERDPGKAETNGQQRNGAAISQRKWEFSKLKRKKPAGEQKSASRICLGKRPTKP
jgi:hypothetical protein